MKWPLLLLAIPLAGCSSYQRSSRDINCRLDYRYASRDELVVDCTVSNHGNKAVTLVEHPDFCTISVRARDRRLVEDKRVILYHFCPAGLSELRAIPAGGSFTFSRSFGYRRVSRDTVEIYNGEISPLVPFFRMRDAKLAAAFSYGFYPYHFPWLGRFLRPGILLAELNAESIIDAR
jgi:hypothetical protein